MTPKERAVMQQALEALESVTELYDDNAVGIEIEAITALREALKPTREGKYYYKDNACTADNADSPDCICWHDEALAEQAELDTKAGELYEMKTKLWKSEQAEQKPVATAVVTKTNTNANYIINIDMSLTEAGRKLPSGEHKLYAAPVRTKDLTDDEIWDLWESNKNETAIEFYESIIAAYKEKNK